MSSGIYKIINKITGQYYVGSAKNIENGCRSRWNVHVGRLNNNKHTNDYLQNAWNKYGNDKFKFVIVELVSPENILLVEQKYLDIAKEEQDKCYNLSFIAGGGGILSQYSKNKIIEYNKKRVFTKETREKIGNATRNRIVSDETRQLLSERNKQYYSRPENYNKLLEMNKKVDYKKVSETRKDKTIHRFINRKTGETYEGCKLDFIKKYNLRKNSVYQMIKRNRPSAENWILQPCL